MKKILLGATISALALTTVAFAGGPDNMAMPVQVNNNHFFIGGALGMGVLNSTQNANGAFTTATTSSTLASSSQVGSSSFLGGLLLGYNAIVGDDFYVGVVGNALYNSLNSKITTESAVTTLPGVTFLKNGK